ncbi:MAG: polyribonucleotide nucleotidyltransferase [Lentisphaeria bacterium]|nr:polyribonucleotide nucleotidyltransferase [Lentisphaeria bacterium]
MSIHQQTIDIGGGREIIIETGKLAKLAGGAVTVRQGDTMVLVTACSADPRPGLDFFPLQVDYREKHSAAGTFPGGFIKREGRPSEKEILTARMTDRPLRPLFPKGFIDDVQIMAGLLSADGENEADVLSIFGASVALMISDIPFNGPIGALRVGRVNGEFIANPTLPEMAESDLDLVYAGIPGKAIMIEGAGKEVSEEDLRDAMLFADTLVIAMCDAQNAMAEAVGKEKYTPKLSLPTPDLQDAVNDYCKGKLDDAVQIPAKAPRCQALNAIYAEMVAALSPRFVTVECPEPLFKKAFEATEEATVRRLILEDGKRSDGRGPKDLRPIECEVGALPRPHGSALFSRGETQALVTTTLGPQSDAQEYDMITGKGRGKKPFFLHYNFPNFSVGETGRIMGPGRREIGHGALAERSVAEVIPEDFPYTIRCVSDILGSNGSSSMASVCGAVLALMDAGVPIKHPVAGISVGMVSDAEKRIFLTDILGSEDHYGDMDFKLSSTRNGITGFQLDLKIAGLDIEGMYEAMLQNKEARMKILDTMEACISEPRTELSPYAPQIFSMHINREKIGALIGPGGKVIREITGSTGAEIDINDDGTVNIFATNSEAMEAAKRQVEAVTAEVEIGRIYEGEVKTVRDFGAFVEIMPGQDGLLHISEMDVNRVNKVEDICTVGDKLMVKVVDVDDRGRVRLSRKAVLEDNGEVGDGSGAPAEPAEPVEEPEVGKIYRGEVKTIKDFGAFIEIVPGRDGLLHISEMADYRVKNCEEICQVGDLVTVKILDIDDRGKIRLSRKAAMAELDGDQGESQENDA